MRNRVLDVDYHECKIDESESKKAYPLLKLTLDKPAYILGEDQHTVLTNCTPSAANKNVLSCPGQLPIKSETDNSYVPPETVEYGSYYDPTATRKMFREHGACLDGCRHDRTCKFVISQCYPLIKDRCVLEACFLIDITEVEYSKNVKS